MTDLTVARTIREQLGGGTFALVTGAKNFIGTENSLIFALPGRPGYVRNGINKVVITLEPSDLYRMDFYRVRAGNGKLIASESDVYFDKLIETFERVTGLVGRMPLVGRA